ncbi:Hydantoinase/oxoprolinase [uncultured Desulfatiglans sp.]|uniref:Hydantoinase/oxoprolinase n=1 Tax=Uncultured Desulfatiglans sp. TaxID=1748965 RepID=A0A653A123_UNCDX|nr:Hydantoinase/oxoprolinase [uncultured Desulfatiglans sp.]
MILGLDVGGTQTDAVLIDESGVLLETKTPTSDDLLQTLRESLDKTLDGVEPAGIERMVFSTTMATNAIIQDLLEPTGMIVSAGPGMNPEWFSIGPSYHVVQGALDHQGFETLPLRKEEVESSADEISREGVRNIGIVSKFSVRNPAHELQMAQWVGDRFADVALGHSVSGVLNFPRRITTTYLNAALTGMHRRFAECLTEILEEKGFKAPRYLLKPDGGTVALEQSLGFPARTAQSGPAASVMGALAVDGCCGVSLVLDIGGTTTDMAVVLNGIPLLAPVGIQIGLFRTLIRSLYTRSIGVGGDSEVQLQKNGALKVGPVRQGPPMALGGPAPTPTDAMVTLGLLDVGSRERARAAMESLGARLGGLDPLTTAEQVLERMAKTIAEAARAFIFAINERPVYTIYEVLQESRIEPESIVIIGGPAAQLADYVSAALQLPYRLPPHSGVANAIGAAVARVTSEINLHADTQRGTLVIPEAQIMESIPYRFNVDQAIDRATDVLAARAEQIGAASGAAPVTIAEKQVFNMIRGFSRTGQIIRLKLCIVPGLIPQWKRGG